MGLSGHRKSIDVKFVEALTARDQLAEPPEDNLQVLQNLPRFSGFVDLVDAAGVDAAMFLSECDDMVAMRCFWRGQYEPLTTRLWKQLCQNAAVIGDVGAHTGYYSLLAKAHCSESTVYSIEPQPSVFARLMLNIRANGWDTYSCLNQAVTDGTEESVDLITNSPDWYMSTGSSLRGQKTPKSKVTTVKALPMKALLDQGVQVLKIDVEGLEPDLLATASEYGFGAVQDVIVECLQPMPASINDLLSAGQWTGRQIREASLNFGPDTQDVGAGDPKDGFNWWLSRRPMNVQRQIMEQVQSVP